MAGGMARTADRVRLDRTAGLAGTVAEKGSGAATIALVGGLDEVLHDTIVRLVSAVLICRP